MTQSWTSSSTVSSFTFVPETSPAFYSLNRMLGAVYIHQLPAFQFSATTNTLDLVSVNKLTMLPGWVELS